MFLLLIVHLGLATEGIQDENNIKTYHLTVIVMHFILKCCHDAREVGHQLPKPEHLGP